MFCGILEKMEKFMHQIHMKIDINKFYININCFHLFQDSTTLNKLCIIIYFFLETLQLEMISIVSVICNRIWTEIFKCLPENKQEGNFKVI